MEMMGALGFTASGTLPEKSKNEFVMLSKVIANMGPMITVVDCNIDGEKITAYDELVLKFEAMNVLSTIASRILMALTDGITAKKKKPSKMPSSSGEILAPVASLSGKTQAS